MKQTKKLFLFFISLCAFTFSPAYAGNYPSKPITIIAPYGTGGSSDLAARTLAGVAPQYLGGQQPVLVINKTGGGGVIGTTFGHRAKPDGHTLILARVGSQSVSPAMKATMPYKYDDFTMLGILEINPVVCATSVDKPYKTMKELVDAVKANPGTLSYSSAGVGSFLHIATPFVLDAMGVENAQTSMRHVPYKGGGGAATAALGGHVDLVCVSIGAVIGHIKSGMLRPLLVTTPERLPTIPNASTVAELGFPELETLVAWSGLFGPPGMDKETVDTLRGMLQKIKTDKSWNKLTKAVGAIPNILDGPETEMFVDRQYKAFKSLVSRLDMEIK